MSEPASGRAAVSAYAQPARAEPGDQAAAFWTRLENLALVGGVILLASLQVTARSEDPNDVAWGMVSNVVNGTASDLDQYRVLTAYLAWGLQHLLQSDRPPFIAMRFVQCLLIFGMGYVLYGDLGLNRWSRLIGIGLLTGLISLSMGRIGPSTFSLDRFDDTIFYLVAALLVLRGRSVWIPALMVLAVANRETSVFIPTLILARHGVGRQIFTDPARRRPLFIALAAWGVAALVWFAIHTYYGPRPRTEDSYWGTAMVLRSLSMPAQTAFFFAAVNLLPVLSLLALPRADRFLRQLFWMVVPLWFAIHIWAARLGEGIMYLAPTTVIIVPLILQGLERQYRQTPAATAPASAATRSAGCDPPDG